MAYVQVNGVDLEYLDEGSGVPVVFSHGSASDLRYWEPQRAIFAERYRFIAFSRRFHGSRSWPADTEDSPDVHVDDLLAVIRRLGAGTVHLVGFSTAVALRAAVREPSLLRSLTVIEPNVPWLLEGDADGVAVQAQWREQNERVRADAAGDAERRAKLWFELVNNRGAGTFDSQPGWFQRMWLDNFDARRPSAAAEPLTCAVLGAVEIPTLILGAEHGMPYSRRIAERLTRCIAGSRLAILPSTTHFMSYQAPAVFNEVLLEFLAVH